jgi:hypothetical protein
VFEEMIGSVRGNECMGCVRGNECISALGNDRLCSRK